LVIKDFGPLNFGKVRNFQKGRLNFGRGLFKGLEGVIPRIGRVGSLTFLGNSFKRDYFGWGKARFHLGGSKFGFFRERGARFKANRGLGYRGSLP